MEHSSQTSSESRYRALFENSQEQVITLSHLFDAISEAGLNSELQDVLGKDEAILTLIEGSAFPRNIDITSELLHERNNDEDRIIVMDVSHPAIDQHSQHLAKTGLKAELVQADMRHIPLPKNSVDILINDCAINFNTNREENMQTLKEIRRVLKDRDSVALVTVVVDRRYDSEKYGVDQELVPENEIADPGSFSSFSTRENGVIELIPGTQRKAWSVPYYEELFHDLGFEYVKFDQVTGRSQFPEKSGISYRRYILKSRQA